MAIDIASKETTRILRQVDNDLNNIESGVNTNSTLISSTLARVNTNSANISTNHAAILTNSTHISSTRARVNTNSTLISSTLARVNTTSANHSTLCSSIGTTTRTNSALNSSIISMLANGTYKGNANYEIPGAISIMSSYWWMNNNGGSYLVWQYSGAGYYPYTHAFFSGNVGNAGDRYSLRDILWINNYRITFSFSAYQSDISYTFDTQSSVTQYRSSVIYLSSYNQYTGFNCSPIELYNTYISTYRYSISFSKYGNYQSILYRYYHWSKT